jgi:hypothetical protein
MMRGDRLGVMGDRLYLWRAIAPITNAPTPQAGRAVIGAMRRHYSRPKSWRILSRERTTDTTEPTSFRTSSNLRQSQGVFPLSGSSLGFSGSVELQTNAVKIE